MELSLDGNVIINGCEFPYHYENEKIVIYLEGKFLEIEEEIDHIIGKKHGILSEEGIYFKLLVPLSCDNAMTDGTSKKYVTMFNQLRSVEYYIENYRDNTKYKEMHLQFPELDYILPSADMINVGKSTFSKEKNIVYNFDVEYRNTTVSIFFVKSVSFSYNFKVKSIAETISKVILSFPETDNISYMVDLYYSIRAFFSFICNRKNIGLRKAFLCGSYTCKTIKNGKIIDKISPTKQTLVLSEKYLELIEDKKQIAKAPKINLYSDKLKELIQLFFENNNDDPIVNDGSIHPSTKYRNLIDLRQSLHISATFEYYVRTLLPTISSQETIDFYKDIDGLIEQYIETATGNKKKKAKEFQRSLAPRISLKEKILKVYEGYTDWNGVKPMLAEWFGDDISEIADAANKWRNELAHEKREYDPDLNVIRSIRLIEHLNYCIVLRYAGYSDESIKMIIENSLIR